ncbi:MAG: hypothetical protein ACFFDW_06075 [Candidatus Thorarchaeota archaeon]
MVIDTKEKALTKRIELLDDDSGYCSDCDYSWCSLKNKIVYCSMKFKGVRGFICNDDVCSME